MSTLFILSASLLNQSTPELSIFCRCSEKNTMPTSTEQHDNSPLESMNLTMSSFPRTKASANETDGAETETEHYVRKKEAQRVTRVAFLSFPFLFALRSTNERTTGSVDERTQAARRVRAAGSPKQTSEKRSTAHSKCSLDRHCRRSGRQAAPGHARVGRAVTNQSQAGPEKEKAATNINSQ